MPATYTNASDDITSVALIDTRVFIGTTTTTADNDAFVEIGGVLSIPNFGPKNDAVTLDTMKKRIKEKGVVEYGGGTFEFVRDFTDAGQTALVAAQKVTKGNYNLRLVFADKATSTGTGTMIDIKVKVMGAQNVAGGPNGALKLSADMAFNSEPAKTVAT